MVMMFVFMGGVIAIDTATNNVAFADGKTSEALQKAKEAYSKALKKTKDPKKKKQLKEKYKKVVEKIKSKSSE